MKIAVVGYGKMGVIIKEIAVQRGHEVYSIDPQASDADYKSFADIALG